MKYSISNKTRNSCVITLIPETSVEQALLKNTEEQDTFLFHYQAALERHLSPSATFINLIDDTSFPSPVTVHYEMTKGIG
jgi:hypothetical protein